MPNVSETGDRRRPHRPLGPNVDCVTHMIFWFADLLNSSQTKSFVLCVMWCADTQELFPCILEAQVTEKLKLPCMRTSWVSPGGFSWLPQWTKLLPRRKNKTTHSCVAREDDPAVFTCPAAWFCQIAMFQSCSTSQGSVTEQLSCCRVFLVFKTHLEDLVFPATRAFSSFCFIPCWWHLCCGLWSLLRM